MSRMLRRLAPNHPALAALALATLALATLCLPALAAPALADQPAPAPDPAAPATVYAPVTEHVFGGEEVEGRTARPDGERVEGRTGPRLTSLVRVRESFRAELLQSAADL